VKNQWNLQRRFIHYEDEELEEIAKAVSEKIRTLGFMVPARMWPVPWGKVAWDELLQTPNLPTVVFPDRPTSDSDLYTAQQAG
jgi:hypothetical protein